MYLTHAAQIIQASEARYVKRVKALLNAYATPLRDNKLITLQESTSIFRCLADIRDVHTRLATVLAGAADTAEDDVASAVKAVAAEFGLARAALLELYVPYARDHAAGLRVLHAALDRPDVARAVEATSTGDERVRGTSLEALLASPLERVASLRDALAALLAQTPPSETGYAALREAAGLFAELGDAASRVNDSGNAVSPAIQRHYAGEPPSAHAIVTAETVLAAQAEAEEGARRAEALEHEVAVRTLGAVPCLLPAACSVV